MESNHCPPADAEVAEFARQVRSVEMWRYLGSLPAYSLGGDLPDSLVRLLRQIDSPNGPIFGG